MRKSQRRDHDLRQYLSARCLGTLLEMPNGIPSRDCIRRVLSALKPEAFQKCFQNWIAACLLGNNADGSQRTIAIDGKTIRRSHDKAAGWGPLHIVSAWASEQGIALGQLATAEKSNAHFPTDRARRFPN